ncbi:hypothetical protein SEA_FUZZBUSTER_4 [Microbacterium phage FuzzBuster]|uniref:Uncharacterized protein n=1 Tax=Microbacterium phage FuzzBuster TaxID=2590935 RepID=A0A516KUX5_9CAUD|nr:hypothetical protein SEA_FUZZBUSTER_4 [Microbacterium phage FuzzBuster]
MTNLIDEMDQVSEALKAAGDDIGSRILHNARRDRIRGLVTPAAADAALSAGKRRLALIAQADKRQPESIFDLIATGVVVPASQLPGPRAFGQGFVIRQGDEVKPTLPAMETIYTHDPGADVRSESSAFGAMPRDGESRRELPFRRSFQKRILTDGYHGTGMTLEALRGLAATLTQAGCPDDRFISIRSTDGSSPELIIDAGNWLIERP